MNDKFGMVYRHADGTVETEILNSVIGMYIIDSMVDQSGWEIFTDDVMVMAQSPSEKGVYAAAYDLSDPIGRLMYSNYCSAENR